MHALARLFLGPTFRNIQSSWVKEGPKLAQVLLVAGANDLGGTLINESISTSAGAGYGQLVPPAELRRLVREAGRVPAQRTTGTRLSGCTGAPRRRGLAARPYRRRRGALRLLQGARRLLPLFAPPPDDGPVVAAHPIGTVEHGVGLEYNTASVCRG
jgi:hypothetical protein